MRQCATLSHHFLPSRTDAQMSNFPAKSSLKEKIDLTNFSKYVILLKDGIHFDEKADMLKSKKIPEKETGALSKFKREVSILIVYLGRGNISAKTFLEKLKSYSGIYAEDYVSYLCLILSDHIENPDFGKSSTENVTQSFFVRILAFLNTGYGLNCIEKSGEHAPDEFPYQPFLSKEDWLKHKQYADHTSLPERLSISNDRKKKSGAGSFFTNLHRIPLKLLSRPLPKKHRYYLRST